MSRELLQAEMARLEVAAQANAELFNQFRVKNDFDGMQSAEAAIKSNEGEYVKLAEKDFIQSFKDFENPTLEVIQVLEFDTLSHKVNREKGIVIDLEITMKKKQVNLIQFCEVLGLDTKWRYKVERLSQRLTEQLARSLSASDTTMKSIQEKFKMSKAAKDVSMQTLDGVDSNTKTCKELQEIIDAIVYVDDGNGKNIYKCISKDAKFLKYALIKGLDNKSMHTIAVSKTSVAYRAIGQVIKSIVDGSFYQINFPMEKESAEEAYDKLIKDLAEKNLVFEPETPAETKEDAPAEKPTESKSKRRKSTAKKEELKAS